jgi:hypothetical protein
MKINEEICNHVVFNIDRSISMNRHASSVVKAVDNEIEYLAERSKQLNQETRVSVYLFGSTVECVIYDKDVLRLPSIASVYRVSGSTALIDATLKSLDDLAKIPELYCNHAYLEYVWTDGQENWSKNTPRTLSARLSNLPENWTVACFVPDQRAVFDAKSYGFPAQNIAVWDTSSAIGFEETALKVRAATESFMTARASGTFKGTNSLFSMGTDTLNKKTVTTALNVLDPAKYMIIPVTPQYDRWEVKDFLSDNGVSFRLGNAFYQLAKREEIQPQKQIAVFEKKTGKVFTGPQARQVVGLPDTKIRVSPQDNPDYTLFIQSTAVNRKVDAGTKLLYLK